MGNTDPIVLGSKDVFNLFNKKESQSTDVYDSIKNLCTYSPYKHQRDAVNFAYDKLNNDGFVAMFADMGTGKTKITIDTFTAMWVNRKKADCLFIVCPKALVSVWQDEIPKHSKLEWEVYTWKSSPSATEARKFDFALHRPKPLAVIFNIEAFQVPNEVLRSRLTLIKEKKRCLMALDESSYAKDISAKRTKNIVAYGNRLSYRIILTGTEIVNSPLDLYSQFEFLKLGFWGMRSFFVFRMNYAVLADGYGAGGRTFKKVVGFQKIDDLMNKVEPHIFRAKKSECLDLPEKVYSVIHVELTAKQRKVYDDLRKHLISILESGEILTIANKVALFTKFRQIPGGSIKCEGESVVIETMPPKLEAIISEISACEDQAIVWASFTHEIELLRDTLDKYGGAVAFYGDVDQEHRAENVHLFQDGKARFFVANPQSAGFGLNLQNCSLQYFYSRHLSPAVNWQAEDRSHRAGQTSTCVYKPLVARNTVDERIEELLAGKTDLREAFRTMDAEELLKLCTPEKK